MGTITTDTGMDMLKEWQTRQSTDVEKIVKFCSEEIARQQDGPLEVGYMFDAWGYALYHNPATLTDQFIRDIGFLVKPSVNAGGYRTYPIRIGYEVRDNHLYISRQLDGLIDAYNEGRVDAQVLYEEYEIIHPFGDGNGRSGKILFNWANGTLLDPQMPLNRMGWYIP